ncbi:MAG: Zn-dependent protease [Myxococcota bacterium]|jgi:Zn-dependent protease
MSAPVSGSMRLFAFRGIDVYLHWSWAVIGLLEIQWRADQYSSIVWNITEYIALFGLVLMHEFGHALACRSVGGEARQIMLWPLGGVAYVRPPPRPGAHLWSIVAGPLVNLLLVPVTLVLWFLLRGHLSADFETMLITLSVINGGLFLFNILPIYPLDGGQIVRALLWFFVGQERSLAIAAAMGLVTSVIGGICAVIFLQSYWLGIIAIYAAWRSFVGLRVARARGDLLSGPRQPTARCPACSEAPPMGALWRCGNEHHFDVYASGGSCPACDWSTQAISCVFCGETQAIADFG